MAAKVIVSYDDPANDRDALMLGHILAEAGAELTLAYVRHSTHAESGREEDEARAAEALLERGARWLEDPTVERRVVLSGSTGAGLRWLAEHEAADIVVFGSDYRTAAGHVAPQRSAQTLLEGGRTAVAIAPANYGYELDCRVTRVGVVAEPGDDATIATARELADGLEAGVTRDEREVDLLVVGSRTEAPDGRLMLTSRGWNEIEDATCPVLVLPRGVLIEFAAPLYIS